MNYLAAQKRCCSSSAASTETNLRALRFIKRRMPGHIPRSKTEQINVVQLLTILFTEQHLPNAPSSPSSHHLYPSSAAMMMTTHERGGDSQDIGRQLEPKIGMK
jgi:hypothetical protein